MAVVFAIMVADALVPSGEGTVHNVASAASRAQAEKLDPFCRHERCTDGKEERQPTLFCSSKMAVSTARHELVHPVRGKDVLSRRPTAPR